MVGERRDDLTPTNQSSCNLNAFVDEIIVASEVAVDAEVEVGSISVQVMLRIGRQC